MHRHGYKGRKFGRETDQRRALIKSLAEALILNERIETTLPKAKEIVPYVEKLITRAKKGDLHNRRLIIADVMTIGAAHKLVDEIAPKLKTRDSGHLRVKRTAIRVGDGTQMAEVSFVDDLKTAPVAKPADPAATQKKKTSTTAKKPAATAKKPAAKPKTATKAKAENK